MPEFTFSLQGEAFLRYLAAPRSFQFGYARQSVIVFGYEGRESYGEAEGGLALLFLVGEDFLTRDQQMLTRKLPEESELVKSLYQLCALVRFVIESGEHMVAVMEMDNEDIIDTYASGVWQLLRRLSRSIVDELGFDGRPPDRSYEELFVLQCSIVPDAGQVG